jgi:N6-adenosine-specific RNA methylase IME4
VVAETALIHFDAARTALEKAASIDEVKDIHDRAEAARTYAHQARYSLEMQNQCAAIKLRAERRGGEILEKIIPHEGGRPKQSSDSTVSGPRLSDIGLSKYESAQWQRIASIPDEIFENHINKTMVSGKELTTASLLALSVKAQNDKTASTLVSVPKGQFSTIVIDPPWPIQKIPREVRPNQHGLDYPTMTLDQIKNLPVQDIAHEDCHLFLWTTQKYLPHAFDLLTFWGFRYVFTMVWLKPGGFQPVGLSQYNCEFALYGRLGTPEFTDTKDFPTCFSAPRGPHSRKPDLFYETIARVTNSPRMDLFARESREGFDHWGNEAPPQEASPCHTSPTDSGPTPF